MKTIFAATIFLLLMGCGEVRQETEKTDSAASEPKNIPLIEPASNLNVTRLYARQSTQYFHGYACSADCSGHIAGYEWAEEENIEDADECTGNSQSFIEGCEAYVEENAEDKTQEENE